jgi:hypothetical protein
MAKAMKLHKVSLDKGNFASSFEKFLYSLKQFSADKCLFQELVEREALINDAWASGIELGMKRSAALVRSTEYLHFRIKKGLHENSVKIF